MHSSIIAGSTAVGVGTMSSEKSARRAGAASSSCDCTHESHNLNGVFKMLVGERYGRALMSTRSCAAALFSSVVPPVFWLSARAPFDLRCELPPFDFDLCELARECEFPPRVLIPLSDPAFAFLSFSFVSAASSAAAAASAGAAAAAAAAALGAPPVGSPAGVPATLPCALGTVFVCLRVTALKTLGSDECLNCEQGSHQM